MALKIEVIAIGNEILTGFTINTNAALLGQALLGIGLRVTSQRTLPDEAKTLQAGLKDSIAKNDLIICTGGLGPTCDDRTREIIADLFKCNLELQPKILEHLEKKYPNRTGVLENQAMIPSKAEFILNDLGTASALIFFENKTRVIFLPGVPSELAHFTHKDLIPLLEEKYPNERSEYRQQCYFMQLGESQVDPILREFIEKYPNVDFGIYPDLELISVHLITDFGTDRENFAYQQPIKEELIEKFKKYFYSDSEQDLAVIITKLCRDKDYTVSLNENSPYLNLRSKLGPVLNTEEGDINVKISGIPSLTVEEEVYSEEINITVCMPNNQRIESKYMIRGNRAMFSTRAEHLVLCELFKALR